MLQYRRVDPLVCAYVLSAVLGYATSPALILPSVTDCRWFGRSACETGL